MLSAGCQHADSIYGPAAVYNGQSNVSYYVPPANHATSYIWSFHTGVNIVSGLNTNSVVVDFTSGSNSGIIAVYGVNSCGDGTSSPLFPVTVVTNIHETEAFSIMVFPNKNKHPQ